MPVDRLAALDFLEGGDDFVGGCSVGDVYADVGVGDFAVFVDDEDGRGGYEVAVEVVDVVELGDCGVFVGVEDGVEGAGAGDHVSCALEVVH